MSYHYQPHQIAVHASDCGFVLWCPTCHGVGIPAGLGYTTRQAALDQAVDDHTTRSGHPAVVVDRPQALPPDLAPETAVATNDTSTP